MNIDILNRQIRTKEVIKKRFEDLYEIAPDDASVRGACFQTAAFEILTEEQWQQVLNRTRHLMEYIKKQEPSHK